MELRKSALVFLALCAALAGLTDVALAQSRTIRFEAEELVGKVRKPEAQIYVTRQNLSEPYQLVLKESFIPKIIESAEHKPF